MDRSTDKFKLVNLKNRSDALEQIEQAERELKRMLEANVALIAYVEDGDNPSRTAP
ncbi:hypothetical protein [Salinithrix halophila]|uniref:Uncharacterized protein n=1 Tax=Salinithrix halophila TaxID=1485204 RepID=A0ABV8JHA5_9BACL